LGGTIGVDLVVVERYDVVVAADAAQDLSFPLGAVRVRGHRLGLHHGDRNQPGHLRVAGQVSSLAVTLPEQVLDLIPASQHLARLRCSFPAHFLSLAAIVPATETPLRLDAYATYTASVAS
jgi:hypothetical protein